MMGTRYANMDDPQGLTWNGSKVTTNGYNQLGGAAVQYGGWQDAPPKAASSSNPRLNKLREYMDFYMQNSGGPANLNDSMNNRATGLAWAQSQMGQGGQDSDGQPQGFYGQQQQLPQQQYVQPQISQQENPYSARAQQLNQGNGMGGDVTNYLRKLMEGSRGFGGNSTPGVRG